MPGSTLPSPKGTRDFYPIEMARRRWIEDKWRKTSVRHGFEEIDGPTFEHVEVFTIKSGEGIVSEIFGAFSGKDETQLENLKQGHAPFALRPEFTPTLARMFAARAKQLPQPTKWFWQGPCFRAERPQRGRLREFLQWNCDILGMGGPDQPKERATADAEAIAVCVDLLASCGLKPSDITVQINDRHIVAGMLAECGAAGREMQALMLLDKRGKIPEAEIGPMFAAMGVDLARFDAMAAGLRAPRVSDSPRFADLGVALASLGVEEWCAVNPYIARGLAYYTGTVFEVIVDGERAVAGGGRYDNLIEVFGGPPTPAVGFGMGDVVLSLVLQDKGLMPTDAQITKDLGLRPDAFVISNGTPESDAAVAPLLARLRGRGLHARRSYKATKNIGKLLKDASDAGSRFAVIIEGAGEVTLKNLDDNTQDRGATDAMLARITP
jgi:histidyl-tRNA synthetase